MITDKYSETLQRIASEFHMPLGNVLNIYELKLLALSGDAKVPIFLTILAEKHVKAMLWKERSNRGDGFGLNVMPSHRRRAQDGGYLPAPRP